MKIINSIENITKKHKGCVVTLGNFDGVHLGHQKILRTVLDEAKLEDAKTMAITFEPHPIKALAPERELKLLTPADAKARLLGRHGMDYTLFINFTREFARQDPEDFIKDILVDKLGAKVVVVGQGYTFGKAKQGTTELLRRRGRKYGFKLKVVRHATMFGKPVSSSRLRSLISLGKVAKAASLLGRPYTMRGTVIKGAGRGGAILKTPTANITTPYEAVPKDGVYVVRVGVGKKRYDGAASIGNNPTFKNAERSYEIHLFDYHGDLRGQELKVFFIERLRAQMTFPSPEELLKQIRIDIALARDILGRV